MRIGRRSAVGRSSEEPTTVTTPSGVERDLGQRTQPLREHSLARVTRRELRRRREARGGSATPARPRRRDRRAAGCRCRSRLRGRARALGGSATWARTIRWPGRALQAGARVSERSQPASSSLPVAAARRLGDAAVDRGTRRFGNALVVVGRDADRRRDAAVAGVGGRPARDARAASADAHRVARHRARVRRRRRARRDRRLGVDRRQRGRARRDPRVRRARVGTRHRVGGRQRDRVRRRAALPVARSAGAVPRPAPARPAARRGRGRGARAAARRRRDRARPRRARGRRGARRACSVARSESLSRRWAVLVPAGFVVVDPLTLADPVLFLREHVRHLAPEPPAAAPDGVLDLRLGAGAGSVSVRFDEADRADPRLAGAPRRRPRSRPTRSASPSCGATRCCGSRPSVACPCASPSGSDPATDQSIVVVERDHLSGRDTRLRGREAHGRAVERRRRPAFRGRASAPSTATRRRSVDERDVAQRHGVAQQVVTITDRDRRGADVDVDDVARAHRSRRRDHAADRP